MHATSRVWTHCYRFCIAAAFSGLVAADPALGEAAPRAFAVIIGIDDFSEAEGGFGNLTACVNDAVGLAELLAGQSYYGGRSDERRIHLFTQAVPETPSAQERQIPRVRREYRVTKGQVLEALGEVGALAGTGEVVFVFVATHGAFADADQGSDLHLLLSAYRAGDEDTYLSFKSIANMLAHTPARVVFILNSCHAGGAVGGLAGKAYFDALFEGKDRYRAIITSCKPDQRSYIAPGADHSFFGKALIEALGGAAASPLTDEAVFSYLGCVPDRVRDAGGAHEQAPQLWRWLGGVSGLTVVSQPSVVGGPTSSLAERLTDPRWLDEWDRDQALHLLHLHMQAAPAESGGGGLCRPDIERILRETSYQELGDYEAWERDRLGLTEADNLPSPEELKQKRQGWVAALHQFLTAEAVDADPDSYYRALGEARMPPTICKVEVEGDGGAAEGGRFSHDRPTYELSYVPDEVALYVAGAEPQLEVQPKTRHPQSTGNRQLAICLRVRRQPVGQPFFKGNRKADNQPPPVPLTEKRNEIRLRIRETADPDLVSSPRALVVNCPSNLTIDAPPLVEGNNVTVLERSVELKGRVWDENATEKPEVSIVNSGDGQTAPARVEGPDAEQVYTWAATVDLEESETALQVGARGSEGAIGPAWIPLTLCYQTVQFVDVPELPSAEWKPQPKPGEEARPGGKAVVRICRGDWPVLEGEFAVGDGRTVSIPSLAAMRPVRREVTFDGAAPDIVEFEPTDVPLTALDAYSAQDAIEGEGSKLRMACGTYTVKVNESDIWQVSPSEFTVEAGDGPLEAPLTASRHADCGIRIATKDKPTDAAISMSLEADWTDPREIEEGATTDLEAGEYRLTIKYDPEPSHRVDVSQLAQYMPDPDPPEGVDRLTSVRITPDGLELDLPFVERYPPCALPDDSVPQVATVVKADGKEVAQLAAGARQLPLDEKIKPGQELILETPDGLECYRGQLRGEGREREVVPGKGGGVLRGSFQLTKVPSVLTGTRLEPVPDGVAFPGRPDSDRRPTRDSPVPVGKYMLFGTLKLPGCTAIPLESEVTVKPGKNPPTDALDLLKSLTEEQVLGAISTHDLSLTVWHTKHVGDQERGTRSQANGALVDLEPVREEFELAAARKELGKACPAAVAKLLEDYTVPDPTEQDDGVRFEDLLAGPYQVRVKLEGGDEWLTPEPDRVEVRADRDSPQALQIKSFYQELDFGLPADAKGWTILVKGKERQLVEGSLLPLSEPKEQGKVEVRKGDLVVWRGELAKGEWKGERGVEEGFARGALQIKGLAPDMEATLRSVDGGVPYTETQSGSANGGPQGRETADKQGTIQWGDLPIGRYVLTVEGFEAVEVPVTEGRSPELFHAKDELKPVLAKLPVDFGAELAADSVTLERVKLLAIPAVQLGMVDADELLRDIEREGWQTALPFGTYHLQATWQDGDTYKWCKCDYALTADASPLSLGPDKFAPVTADARLGLQKQVERVGRLEPGKGRGTDVADEPLDRDAVVELRPADDPEQVFSAKYQTTSGKWSYFWVDDLPLGEYDVWVATEKGDKVAKGARLVALRWENLESVGDAQAIQYQAKVALDFRSVEAGGDPTVIDVKQTD